jgi:hypothetical protein
MTFEITHPDYPGEAMTCAKSIDVVCCAPRSGRWGVA